MMSLDETICTFLVEKDSSWQIDLRFLVVGFYI